MPSNLVRSVKLTVGLAAAFLASTAFAGRYWLGGEGYWLDTAKWAESASTTGGASVPDSSGGTVYFNNGGTLVFDDSGNIGSSDVKINSGTSSDPVVWSASDSSCGLTTTGKIRVGADSAPAALKIEGGTYSATAVYVPRKDASEAYGLFVFNGGRLTVSDSCYVGYKANTVGEFVLNDGDIIVNKDVFYLGEGGTGRFTMNGGTFTMLDSGYGFCICHDTDGSVAELTLNGGVMTTPKFRIDKLGSAESGTIVFNGGTLKATRKQDDYIAENSSLSCVLQSGGLILDTAGFDVTIAHEFTGSGPLIKKGAGTLTVADGSKFTDIIVYAGTAVVGGTTYEVNAEAAIDASAGGDLGEVVIHGEKLEGWLKDADYTNVGKYNAYGTAQLEQPVPVIIDVNGNRKTYINLETGTTYNDTINNVAFSFTTEDLAPRTLKILSTVDSDPVENVRDVGSWPLMGNAKMNQGVIFRGGHLDHFKNSTADQKAASALAGLKSEIDLRMIELGEVASEYQGVTKSWAAVDADYVYCPINYNTGGSQISSNDPNFTNQIRRVFSTLGNAENLPSYFHCRIGTDRTGIVGLLLLGMMGVEEEVLYRDYLMSNFANIGGSRDSGVPETFLRYILRGNCNSGKYVYNTKDGEYGSSIASRCRQYLEMCGVTEAELAVITDALSGETPAEVLARVNAYETANNVRTVSYVPYEGSTSTNATHRLAAGANILPASNPTRDGYVFKGWDTANESNGIVYALWQEEAAEQKKLKWDNNGGDCLISNAENWYVSGTDPHEHGYLPRIIDEVEFSNDDARYAALLEGETFSAKSLYIGRGWNSTSPQVVDVTNGTFTVEGTVNLGQYGAAGELNVFGGAVTMKQVLVAHWGAHTYNKFNIYGGNVNVTGGSWPGAVSIGNQDYDTLGVMTITNGTVNIGGGASENNSLIVGFSNLKTPSEDLCCKLLVSGGATTVDGASIYVANATGSGGLLQVSDGSLSASSSLVVGNSADTWARVYVSGGEVSAGSDMNIGVGSNSWAQVDITGGKVTVGGTTRIGNHNFAQHAVLNVAGGELDAGEISVARNCDGTLYITDGGVVNATQIQKSQSAPAAASPKVFIDDGTIVAKAKTGLFFASVDSVIVGDGGAAFDTDGFDVTIEACRGISGTGSFTKKGEGTLEVKADSFGIHCDWNVRGMIIVEAGTLKLPAGQTIYCAGTSVAEGATLDANGSTIVVVTKKVVKSVWTNATGDGNPTTPSNWRSTICYFDEQGDEVASISETLDGALPTADTDVLVPLAGVHPDLSGMTVKSTSLYGAEGTISALRGIVQVPAVVKESVAWYDPDDMSTVATNAEGKVVSVRNKGSAGDVLDLVPYDSTSVPSLGVNNRISTRCTLEHHNEEKGLVSVNSYDFGSNGQTLVGVMERFSAETGQAFCIELQSGSSWDYKGLLGIAQWGWESHMSVSCVTNDVSAVFTVKDNMSNSADKPYIYAIAASPTSATGYCAYDSSGFMTKKTSKVYEYDSLDVSSNNNGLRKIFYGMRLENPCGSSGLIGEAMAFNRVLTAEELDSVQNYLYAKWFTPADMSNIPSNILLENNATLDFGGGNWTFDTIKGAGTIGTANVTVTASVEPGLTVGGAVTFADGATFDISAYDKAPVGTTVTFLTADSIVGWPRKVRSKYRISTLRLVANGNGTVSLVGELSSAGFAVHLR